MLFKINLCKQNSKVQKDIYNKTVLCPVDWQDIPSLSVGEDVE